MNVNPDVNFEELARSTDDFNGAQLKAVCVEAGMLALRRDATEVHSVMTPSIKLCIHSSLSSLVHGASISYQCMTGDTRGFQRGDYPGAGKEEGQPELLRLEIYFYLIIFINDHMGILG